MGENHISDCRSFHVQSLSEVVIQHLFLELIPDLYAVVFADGSRKGEHALNLPLHDRDISGEGSQMPVCSFFHRAEREHVTVKYDGRGGLVVTRTHLASSKSCVLRALNARIDAIDVKYVTDGNGDS